MKNLFITLLCAVICMPFLNVQAQDGMVDFAAIAAAKIKCGKKKNVSTNLQRVCINATSADEAKTKYENRALTIANISCDNSDCQLSSDKCEPYFVEWQGGGTTPDPTPNADSTKWCFSGNSTDYRVGCTDCTSDLAVSEVRHFREGANFETLGLSTAHLYPNPAKNQVWLELTSESEKELGITVMNNLGQKVLDNNVFKLSQGLNVHLINTESLSPGVYYMTISHKGLQLEVKQLVIQ